MFNSKRSLREQREKNKKMDLVIGVKNFGPISCGKISLKPLTLFIGPNNSGKSYAAMLIHSLLESYTLITPRKVSIRLRPYFFSEFFDYRTIYKVFSDLVRNNDNLEKGKEIVIPKKFIETIYDKVSEEIYEKRLSKEIGLSYACPLKDLIRIGKRSFSLRVNFNSYDFHLTYHKNKLIIKEHQNLDIKIKIKLLETQRPIFKREMKDKELLIKIGRGIWKMKAERRFVLGELIEVIIDFCLSKILEHVPIPCFYLPAARSGILQGHRMLAASIVKKAPLVGIERLEIPKFSGVVSDFISTVIMLPEKKGQFYKLAQEFEKELIKGEILVKTFGEYLYPEIKYKFQDTEIPLHRSSSTVSELAPLFLYSKYIIEPGSILIIEEPEAHLHPENQRILAKFLVKLLRKNVNIIITTHSEYLLGQLSSFILLSKVEPQKRVERYKYSEEDFLKPDEIASYVFDYDKKSGGHKITEVKITEEDGISQEEFLKIHEALYEESFKLQRELQPKV
jgi:predicted ATPase